MCMIEVDTQSGLAINPDDLSAMHFVDISGGRALQLIMKSGKGYLIKHRPYDSADIYQLHSQILAAGRAPA